MSFSRADQKAPDLSPKRPGTAIRDGRGNASNWSLPERPPTNSEPISQKVMLSKALQRANTAVLLDNAANFKGAVGAYNDACQLLHSVILHSSGSDIERLKLQEIVRCLPPFLKPAIFS